MSNITTQVANSSGFGEQPIRVGSSSFSRPAALIGGATALIALTAIATTLVVRPAASASDAGAEARSAAALTQAKLASQSLSATKVVGTVDGDKPARYDGDERPESKPAAARVDRAPQRQSANTTNAKATIPVTKPAPVATAAACASCGVIESVTPFEKKGEGSGLGAVAGGVLGGVVGHQVGGGNGKKAMTVLGAIGGGMAGHEVEKRQRSTTLYAVKVRMEDGTMRSFTQSTAPSVGQKVTVEGSQVKARA